MPGSKIALFITFILYGIYYTAYYFIWSPLLSSSLTLYFISGFHLLGFLSILSLSLCVFIDPGKVPTDFTLSRIPLDLQYKNDKIHEVDYFLTRVAYCVRCKQDKPPRAHHCKRCNICVLRFNHHCPYIGNCVGLKTQKVFILFLFYSALGCLVGLIHVAIIVNDIKDYLQVFFLVGSGIYTIALSRFAIKQFALVCLNLTEIEVKWNSKKLFDTGTVNNIKQVFGNSVLMWMIPIDTPSADGILYRTCIRILNQKESITLDKFIV